MQAERRQAPCCYPQTARDGECVARTRRIQGLAYECYLVEEPGVNKVSRCDLRSLYLLSPSAVCLTVISCIFKYGRPAPLVDSLLARARLPVGRILGRDERSQLCDVNVRCVGCSAPPLRGLQRVQAGPPDDEFVDEFAILWSPRHNASVFAGFLEVSELGLRVLYGSVLGFLVCRWESAILCVPGPATGSSSPAACSSPFLL